MWHDGIVSAAVWVAFWCGSDGSVQVGDEWDERTTVWPSLYDTKSAVGCADCRYISLTADDD